MDTASRLTLTSGSTSSEVSSVMDIRLTVNGSNVESTGTLFFCITSGLAA